MHRHLQPGRDLRRGRPLPRQRRGRSRGCSSSAPARPTEAMLPHLYVHYDDGAVSHLFHVAAGLDSMAVGEGQILGQTREALRLRPGARHRRPRPQRAVPAGAAGRQARPAPRPTSTRPRRRWSAPRSTGPTAPSAASPAAGSSSSAPARWPASPTATVARRGAADVVVVNRTAGNADRLAARVRRAAPSPLAELGRRARRRRRADHLHRRHRRPRHRDHASQAARAAPTGRSRSSTSRCRTTSTRPSPTCPASPWSAWPTLADELRDGRRAAARSTRSAGSSAEEVAAFLAARRQASVTPTVVALRSMATAVVDAEMARLEARLPDLDDADPRRGPARRAPGRRQAAPPADRPGQGARQRARRRVLRRRARRAVRARPRGRRRRHPRPRGGAP